MKTDFTKTIFPFLESISPYRPDFPEAFAALDEWQRDATARRGRWTLRAIALAKSPIEW